MGASMIHGLTAAIIRDGKVPSDWEQGFIVCLYKRKGDALERGNYRGLKLTEQAMKILERIVDGLIRQLVSIDDSQFGFVPGRGTTDAIFVVRQLQEKYLAANKRLDMAFVDLEKAFDRVPRKVICWAQRKLGVEEWIMRLVQGICMQMRGAVPCWWGVQWRVLSEGSLVFTKYSAHCSSSLCLKSYHESSALGSPGKTSMLMALDMERSNGEERTESKCRKDKDHDLWYGTEPPAEFRRVSMRRLSHWSRQQQHLLQWLQALGAQEMQWVQALEKNKPDYRCTRCQGTARPLDGRPQKEVQVGPDKLEVVASFRYLGDMLSAAGGCELLTTTRVKTAWKKFKDLLPVLSSRHLSLKTRGRVYSSWPLTKPNLERLQRNDRAMIRQICNVRPQDIVTTRSNELLVRLGIEDLDLILKERRLRWYGLMERSNGAVKTALTYRWMESVGLGGPRWHKNS